MFRNYRDRLSPQDSNLLEKTVTQVYHDSLFRGPRDRETGANFEANARLLDMGLFLLEQVAFRVSAIVTLHTHTHQHTHTHTLSLSLSLSPPFTGADEGTAGGKKQERANGNPQQGAARASPTTQLRVECVLLLECVLFRCCKSTSNYATENPIGLLTP